MKQLLITIAAVVLVGCGESQQMTPESETPTTEPVISIHRAAGLGEDEIVKQYLADGVDINLKDEFGYTPLHKAINSRYLGMVDILVAEGADVNAKNNYGSTPLHMAVSEHWGDAIELLIDNGGNINAKNNTGETPLDYTQVISIDVWKEEVISLIRKHGGKHGTISSAAIGGDIEAVKEFLAAGADVNAKTDRDELTPLHIVSGHGHKEIAELLIVEGADVNAKSENGVTPLHWAALHGHKEVAELLIAKGADVNAKNDFGETPLDGADGEIADLLRKHGGKTAEELKAEGK